MGILLTHQDRQVTVDKTPRQHSNRAGDAGTADELIKTLSEPCGPCYLLFDPCPAVLLTDSCQETVVAQMLE